MSGPLKKAFPGPIGFLSGWMLWFAYTVACSLYALGFAGYFWEFFHKYFPYLGAASNLFLAVYQFKFDPLAWYVALGWIFFGLLAYFVYFQKQSGEDMPTVLDALPLETARAPYRVLVPVANPDTISGLLDLAIPMVRARQGDLIATTVVRVPFQLPIQEGMKYIDTRMPLLRAAQAHAREKEIDLVSDIRVAHRVEEGILSAADSENIDLTLMGRSLRASQTPPQITTWWSSAPLSPVCSSNSFLVKFPTASAKPFPPP